MPYMFSLPNWLILLPLILYSPLATLVYAMAYLWGVDVVGKCIRRIPKDRRPTTTWVAMLLLVPVVNTVVNFCIYPPLFRAAKGCLRTRNAPEVHLPDKLALVFCITHSMGYLLAFAMACQCLPHSLTDKVFHFYMIFEWVPVVAWILVLSMLSGLRRALRQIDGADKKGLIV